MIRSSFALRWPGFTLMAGSFVADPNAVFPGSNMATFAGLTDADDRRAIIEHLETLR